MLKLCRKGDYLTAVPLSAAEDEAMRKAFGRFASVAGRRAGTEIVQRYQHQGHGNWFLCDCLDGVETRPPALVPVMESFIRRHTDPPWPAHAEDCEFFREPGEQKAITNSYGPPSPGPLRLVRRYGQAESAALEREVYRSYAWRREGLATMLRLLQIKSGLNRLTTASSRPKLGDQYRLLRAAAGEIEIDLVHRQVWVAGEPVSLLQTEFRLLEFLARHAGRTVSRQVIFEQVWGRFFAASDNLINVHIAKLRRKPRTGLE